MKKVRDLLTIAEIKDLVDTFYGKVKQDELLAPVFNARIGANWTQHLEKMYSFWKTVLFAESSYHGSPFPPHSQLPVDHSHFTRWLELFNQTVDELFLGEKAKEAKWRAAKMAEMFESKIEYYKNYKFKSLL
jgi:hemoglobin